MVVFKFWSAKV